MNHQLQPLSNEHCLICNDGRKNKTLYWHKDDETGDIWTWCNKCNRGYHIFEYCDKAGISLREFLKLKFSFAEAQELEVNAIEWPRSFINISESAAAKGLTYLQSRGLKPIGDIYYDTEREGIVFPYYVQNTFVGAQVRFVEARKTADGDDWKITTLPGTRLGYLFWGWSQNPLPSSVKYLVLTEGAFNAASLQQALNTKYGNLLKNPYRCIAASGSGASGYQCGKLKELRDEAGIKVIAAPDSDEAGIKMLEKLRKADACSHYALVEEDSKDWNDKLKDLGDEGLAAYFASRLKKS